MKTIGRRQFLCGVGALAVAGALAANSRRAFAVGYWSEVDQRWVQDKAAAVEPTGIQGAEDPDDQPIAAQFLRQQVDYASDERTGTIVIDPANFFAYLITGDDSAMRYGVGVGREGFGWHGTVHIGDKKVWPTWTPPAEMITREAANGNFLPASMPGGEDNPLGARAMYLYDGNRDTLYRIHGTNQPWSIGLNMSSGCFRMMNDDVIDLYNRVQIGAKVIVL